MHRDHHLLDPHWPSENFLQSFSNPNMVYEFWFPLFSCKFYSKDNTVWPILSFREFFITYHQKFMLYFCFKHPLKNWIRNNMGGLTNTALLEKFDQLLQKTYMVQSTLCFFNLSSKFWPRSITVWSISSFQGSYIFSFEVSLKFSIFSRILYNSPPKSSYIFGVQNFLKKIVSETIRFNPYCYFKDSIKFSLKAHTFFLFQRTLRNWI